MIKKYGSCHKSNFFFCIYKLSAVKPHAFRRVDTRLLIEILLKVR